MITRRESQEIIYYILNELKRRQFPYITDGKIDLSKTTVGTLSGFSLANNSVEDRHVKTAADIRGTKIRVATVDERGTVELAEHEEEVSGLAVQADDPRLIRALVFIDLEDVPDSYWNKYKQIPTVNEAEDSLEWRPVSYVDGGVVSEDYAGAINMKEEFIDGGSATTNDILDGGSV